MSKLLKDQTAIITGGTSGIGKAIAIKFAEHGANIIILGRDKNKGIDTARSIKSCKFYSIDITNIEAINKLFPTLGKIDILVNNAGVNRDKLFVKMTEQDWNNVIDINLKSIYNTCQSLVHHMMKLKQGKIINITSISGLIGNVGQVNYSASKAGIIGFTKSLAKELGKFNIRVNGIAPGFIETNMTKELSKEYKNQLLKQIPLGRLGHPNEVADAALFLASEMSRYMTGQIITIDGGLVI